MQVSQPNKLASYTSFFFISFFTAFCCWGTCLNMDQSLWNRFRMDDGIPLLILVIHISIFQKKFLFHFTRDNGPKLLNWA